MRFEFLEMPGESQLTRPVIPVQVEDLDDPPQLCLVDTGATTNRFGAWLAEATGIDLSDAPAAALVVGGVSTTAYAARADLTIAGVRYDAPVTFCDPWPLAFNLLGQEGFMRFFRVSLCAAEGWLEVEPEEILRA
jgi:Aspartyl protease